MEKPNKHASLLYTLVYKARQIGEGKPGSDEAFACYQIIDTAMNEAEIYGITLKELGLEGFKPESLLEAPKKAA
jgi:hypothetical protein